jgi:hypothetical protein
MIVSSEIVLDDFDNRTDRKLISEPLETSWSKEGADVVVWRIIAAEGAEPQEGDVASTALKRKER